MGAKRLCSVQTNADEYSVTRQDFCGMRKSSSSACSKHSAARSISRPASAVVPRPCVRARSTRQSHKTMEAPTFK